MQLYQDQRTLLNKLWNSLQENDKVLFQSQTGSGKTVMASALIKYLISLNKQVAFIVDRQELVQQSFDTFGANNVSILKAGHEQYFNADFPVQVIMIQTYYARKDKLPDLNLDYIIIDEVHQNWNTQRINELLRVYSNAKVVGLSATPICNKGYLLNGFDDYVEGLQARELIKLGRLCPTVDYSFESYGLELDRISITNGDYDTSEVDEQVLDLNKVAFIVDEWERLAINRKTLIFGNSIRHAEMLCDEFKKRGHKFDVIHSKNNNRNSIKRLQEGTIQGLVNVGILIAGFDYKPVSCIVNARPTKIERVARQIVGRGRRTCSGKIDNLHLDFADYIKNFGCTDDDRYYSFASAKKNEDELYKDCPECGNIEQIHIKECSVSGYSFELVEEIGASKPKTKKQLERLIKIKSMQDTMLEQLRELVKERGYKTGYSWHLFKDLLMNAKGQGTGLKYYSKILRRIETCKSAKTRVFTDNDGVYHEPRPYSVRWLLRQ